MNQWLVELITFTSLQAIVWTPAEGEVEGCGICGGGAAVLKLSSGVFLMMTALAAFLLVA